MFRQMQRQLARSDLVRTQVEIQCVMGRRQRPDFIPQQVGFKGAAYRNLELDLHPVRGSAGRLVDPEHDGAIASGHQRGGDNAGRRRTQ